MSRFVVIEGLDGAGTTTQCAALARELRAEGREVLTTREPSDGPIGKMIRQALTRQLGLSAKKKPLTPETLALMFAADRVDHVAREIEPALERGAVVLSDRYLLSSLAYQGSQLPIGWVEEINARARVPDLTLFLEIDPELGAQRRAVRGGKRELYETRAIQRRTAKQYLAAIALRRKAGEKVVVLDGGASVNEVTAAAMKALGKRR
ncbi:MAG: tmk [Myxococcaceae bacterium]|nr:tmk [Myxococcaceae bacterium]